MISMELTEEQRREEEVQGERVEMNWGEDEVVMLKFESKESSKEMEPDI